MKRKLLTYEDFIKNAKEYPTLTTWTKAIGRFNQPVKWRTNEEIEYENEDEDKAVEHATEKLKNKTVESFGEISAVISDYMSAHSFKYGSYEDYVDGMQRMVDNVAKNLKIKIYDDVKTIDDFKKIEKKDPKIGLEITHDMGAPGTGSVTYKIEKIENNKVYLTISKDTRRILDMGDVI